MNGEAPAADRPQQLEALIGQAQAAHGAGRLQQAELLYRQVLAHDDGEPRALHGLGVIAYQVNQDGLAADYIQGALRRAPAQSAWLDDLVTVLRRDGRLAEAAGLLEAALAREPANAARHAALGSVYNDLGRRGDAAAALRRSLELDPGQAQACNDLGSVLKDLGRAREAESYYRRAVELKSDHAAAHNNLSIVLKERRDLKAAEEHARRAVEIKPDFPEAWNTLALVHYEYMRTEEAVRCFRQALALRPAYAAAHSNLAILLVDLHDLETAERHCLEALRLNPGFGPAMCNLGMMWHVRGDVRRALHWYERAIERTPQEASAHFNRALAHLQLGELAAGWEGYEWGIKSQQRTYRDFGLPVWRGEPLHDRSIVVFGEQGVGDEVMFAGCIPDVLERAGRCIVDCDPRLASLFARSFPGAIVKGVRRDTGHEWLEQLKPVDFQIAAGSLPRYLRPDLGSFPRRRSYLEADPERVAAWRRRLERLGDAPKVGISWRGGRKPRDRMERSLELPRWLPLLRGRDAHFINLQYGDTSEEIVALRRDHGIVIHAMSGIDPLTELDDFAALIAALDMVVSVDNSTVHLAGALGVRVLVLLPFVSDWRWMEQRADTPWYETVQLIRQPAWGQWEPVFERVAAELAHLTGARDGAQEDAAAQDADFTRTEHMLQVGDLAAAEAGARELSVRRADSPAAWQLLARSLEALGRDHDAVDCLRRSVALDEDRAPAHHSLGRMLRRLARLESTLELYRAAPPLLDRVPRAGTAGAGGAAPRTRDEAARRGHAGGAGGGADAAVRAGLEEALAHHRAAAELAPAWATAQRGVGETLLELGRDAEALDWLERAAAGDPQDATARVRLATAQRLAGAAEAAEASLHAALRVDADHAQARFELGTLRLWQGRLAEGWPLYRARREIPGFAPRAHFPFPDWDGEALAGRSILVFAEQGLGEEIMFASCLPQVAAAAGRCVVECDPRLAPLLRRSFPAVRVEGRQRSEGILWLWSLPELHLQAPIGDLPGYLRASDDDFPDAKAFLVADARARANWRRRLRRRLGQAGKVGVAWRGGRTPGDRARRSIPAEALAQLQGCAETRFVCVQYGARRAELERLSACGLELAYWPEADSLSDLDGFAALLSALDVVVTADNSVAHLAAALGVPTWILLPTACDWRWRAAGRATPWYGSARLFRQRAPGDWSQPLAEVSAALAQHTVAGGRRDGG